MSFAEDELARTQEETRGMTTTTEWTEREYRVEVSVCADGATRLMCHSQSLSPGRQIWVMSLLTIPSQTPLGEARRVVAHWLAFYDDPQLRVDGVRAFTEVFKSVEEPTIAQVGTTGASRGNIN